MYSVLIKNVRQGQIFPLRPHSGKEKNTQGNLSYLNQSYKTVPRATVARGVDSYTCVGIRVGAVLVLNILNVIDISVFRHDGPYFTEADADRSACVHVTNGAVQRQEEKASLILQ